MGIAASYNYLVCSIFGAYLVCMFLSQALKMIYQVLYNFSESFLAHFSWPVN